MQGTPRPTASSQRARSSARHPYPTTSSEEHSRPIGLTQAPRKMRGASYWISLSYDKSVNFVNCEFRVVFALERSLAVQVLAESETFHGNNHGNSFLQTDCKRGVIWLDLLL